MVSLLVFAPTENRLFPAPASAWILVVFSMVRSAETLALRFCSAVSRTRLEVTVLLVSASVSVILRMMDGSPFSIRLSSGRSAISGWVPPTLIS